MASIITRRIDIPRIRYLRVAKTCTSAIVAVILSVAGVAGGWALYLRATGNVHAVTQGVAYRSAQLDTDQFVEIIKDFHIKSVINLRGDNAGEDWYTKELDVAAKHGVIHYDVGMSAKQEPDEETVARLLAIMKTAPRPFLIHCYGGADRSGLASALYKRFIERQPVAEAAKQLSFSYGHFPWLGSGTAAMDQTFSRLTLGD